MGTHFKRIGWYFFLFLDEIICCGYSLEASCLGASNELPQHMFSWWYKKTFICILLLPGIMRQVCKRAERVRTAMQWMGSRVLQTRAKGWVRTICSITAVFVVVSFSENNNNNTWSVVEKKKNGGHDQMMCWLVWNYTVHIGVPH